MKDSPISLCAPDSKKSCFGCCPPIRPAGYDHLDHKNIIKRILRENTDNFQKNGHSINPIIGYSCWGLGYLDKACKRIGCLLHPVQNRGKDLRFRVDYGEKCSREICREATIFSRLNPKDQNFWIHLTDGFDSFHYSSKKKNQLFRIILWGETILSLIPPFEGFKKFSKESFFNTYYFFTTKINPGGNAYLLNNLVNLRDLNILKENVFLANFEIFSKSVKDKILENLHIPHDCTHTHLLPFEKDFTDFLRISLGIAKIDIENALMIKNEVDTQLRIFEKGIQ